MNVFYLDHDTRKCAEAHCDKHVVKMILEYAQIMSTAHRVIDEAVLTDELQSTLYKSTHKNHPSSVWARSGLSNYVWLYNLWMDLGVEYELRYERKHLTIQKLWHFLAFPPHGIDRTKPFSPPPLCMPDEFKTDDHVESYRNYYRIGKAGLHSWKKRDVPSWIVAEEHAS